MVRGELRGQVREKVGLGSEVRGEMKEGARRDRR
jgi:hypothetical protein